MAKKIAQQTANEITRNLDKVRLGVIGCGGMARSHMSYFESIQNLEFTAAADPFPAGLEIVKEKYGVECFNDGHKLIKSGLCDAILIATPHFLHPELSIAGLKAGLHVFTEKPVAVTAEEAAKVDKVHEKHPDLVYAAMFQTRSHPVLKTAKELIDTDQIGKIQRMAWIVTNWFRSQAYYNQAAWRATWKGEGGGVLLNQCPHNLDTICWLVGTPTQVQAHLSLGKYHHIEVEDEVTAYMEWAHTSGKGKNKQVNDRVIEGGATGVFITTTGEHPGTDRLEIVGDKGKITIENGIITLDRLTESASKYIKTTEEAFGGPTMDKIVIEPAAKEGSGHREMMVNFVEAILMDGTPEEKRAHLVCAGEDGLHELELGNAMLYSGLTNSPINLPMDRKAFAQKLKDLGDNSTFKKGEIKEARVDMKKSFH